MRHEVADAPSSIGTRFFLAALGVKRAEAGLFDAAGFGWVFFF